MLWWSVVVLQFVLVLIELSSTEQSIVKLMCRSLHVIVALSTLDLLSLYCLPCNGRSIVCTQELTYFLCIPHSRSHIALKHSHNNNDTRCTSITLFIRIQAKLVTLVARLMDQINRKLRSLFTMSFSKNIVVRQCEITFIGDMNFINRKLRSLFITHQITLAR